MKASEMKRVIDAGLADVETTGQDVDSIVEYIRSVDSAQRRSAWRRPFAIAATLVLLLIALAALAILYEWF